MPKRNLKAHHHIVGTLAYAQRAAIIEALLYCSYNMTNAASRLKIGRTSLYRLVDELDIPRPPKMTLGLVDCAIDETGSLPTSRIVFSDGRYRFASAHDCAVSEGTSAAVSYAS